jgi:hypothetical protein
MLATGGMNDAAAIAAAADRLVAEAQQRLQAARMAAS